jgi:uncharacterized protein (DUF342 family)
MATGTYVRIIVSADRMNAWVRVHPQADPKSITRAHLLTALEESRIPPAPAVDVRLGELCQLLQAGTLPDGDFLVAQGTGPTDPIDAQFDWDQAFRRSEDPADQASRISHYDRNTIISAARGAVLGRITLAKPGESGSDVHGNPIPPSHKPRQILLRGNVEMAGDGSVVALCDGRVVLDDGKISIASVLDIPGDVDFGTGNIETPGDVVIRGSVKDLFQVRSARDITIDGHVDGAVLDAGGAIVIHGGIHGRGKAIIHAASRVEAKLCDGASIEAGGTFSVQRECINCRVAADKISSPAGTIIGGYAWARNSIEVQNLGSPAAVKTLVSAGVPVKVMDQAVQMVQQAKECMDNARKIRHAIEPLMREMRRLSAQHRERATELMFQADTLEQQARNLDTKREELLAQAAPDVEPAIAFGGRIYAGVIVIINGRSTAIELGKELRGPVRIMERKIEGVTTLVAIDTISGGVRPLPTVRFTAEAEKQATQAFDPAECLATTA